MSARAAGGTATVVAGTTLPYTGINLFIVGGICAALLLVGFGLTFLGRRKKVTA
jgi:LPXTG-motif cell wall-anchored protein